MTQFLTRYVRGNPLLWLLAALITILAGYTDLWRGGTEAASLLLVLGYVFLLPIAILAWGAGEPPPRTGFNDIDNPPYGIAAAVGIAVFILYAATLAPSTAMWDTSEYIAAAKVLGIPHPPGNPLFVLIAHAFAMIPIPVSYAERVNLLAATTSAISASLWFLVAFRSLQGWNMPRPARSIAAVAAAWLGATAFTVWNQSVVNEKVYTVAMLGVAVVSWAILRWNDDAPNSRRADAVLVFIAYLCGLAYTNHPAGLLPLPAVGLYVLIRRPATVLRWKVVLASIVALVVGLTPFAFQPIRAAYHPEINVGTPTACAGTPEFSCTFSKVTWDKLMSNINREQYGGHAVADRQVPFTAQVGMWWHYFKWQWIRDAFHDHAALQRSLALLFLALGLAGGALHFQRDRATFAFVAPLMFTLTPALIFYLNFKYGWTQAVELGNTVDREVRDRDYFYVWSFATWGIWAGMGITALWQTVARAISKDGIKTKMRSWAIASPVLLLALIPTVTNSGQAPRSGQDFTAKWARDLLQTVEPYGVLITNGDNDSFPVWYAQFVENVRRDVTVVLIPYLRSEWYAQELIRQRPQQYDGTGLEVYKSLAGPKPDQPLMSLSSAELDQVPPLIRLDRAALFSHSNIRATIPPGMVLRDQQLILQIIKDLFPGRPIYFSRGGYAEELGLRDYVVVQGLAQRLVDEKASENPEYMVVDGSYFDMKRSLELWNMYEGHHALMYNGGWIDESSLLIPTMYGLLGQSLARGLLMTGQGAKADSIMEFTMQFARASHVTR